MVIGSRKSEVESIWERTTAGKSRNDWEIRQPVREGLIYRKGAMAGKSRNFWKLETAK